MKLTVDKEVLSEAVNFVMRMLPSRPPSPILSGILIKAEENKLVLSAFDYETSAQIEINASVSLEGKVLVPGALLNNVSQKLPNKPVDIQKEDQKLLLTCGSAKYVFSLMPLAEYPPIPDLSDIEGYKMEAKEFVNSISQVVSSAAREDITMVITGVQVSFDEQKIRMIATDRYRVAVKDVKKDTLQMAGKKALIPAKTLNDISKTLGNVGGDINITVKGEGEHQIIGFKADNKTVTSLLIGGNYPPVTKLFPEEGDHYAVFRAEEILEATKRMSLVLERDSALRFVFTKDKITLEGSGSEIAQATESVECEMFGEEITVMLRPQFFCDGLLACQEEFIKISFAKTDNPNRPGPVLITPKCASDEEVNFKYLLQPNLLMK